MPDPSSAHPAPMLSFATGTAVVAGGSGGIGAAIARAFATAGLPVVVSYHRNPGGAEKLRADIEAAGGRCTVTRADLTRPAEAEALLELARSGDQRIGQVVYAAGASFDFGFVGEIDDQIFWPNRRTRSRYMKCPLTSTSRPEGGGRDPRSPQER